MFFLKSRLMIAASLAARLIHPILAAASSASSSAPAPIFLPDPVIVPSSSASPNASPLPSSSSSPSTPSSALAALSLSSLSTSSSTSSFSPTSVSLKTNTIDPVGPRVSVLVTVTISLALPTVPSRTIKSATGGVIDSPRYVASLITSAPPNIMHYWVECPSSVKPTECGVHTGMDVWEMKNSYEFSMTIRADDAIQQKYWSMRQFCTLNSPSWTCTNVVNDSAEKVTYASSRYRELLLAVELTTAITQGQDALPPLTVTATITNSISSASNTTTTTSINYSSTTVIPLHFPIVTKDAKDKDIHWGAELVTVDSSEVTTYMVKCIDPKKAAIKDCESFYRGGITVMTGPTMYGYGFSYSVSSVDEWHTKNYQCTHPPSSLLANSQDDIGKCTSIYGPTLSPTTMVTTSVTSMSASLANTTPVTVTEGAWMLSPMATEGKAREGGAVALDPRWRVEMGDVGVVFFAGLVGVVVGVLGVLL